ncbi:hypothetical protein GGX14DRAFT_556112 [Mycena pura]|uniref:Uncharacterized protein n=1 Tax=Mycena pura TaxID=153505 RepID=A0AAD6YNX7_9AGAR|nr:hypothetical protein GGX14DRAFT_556112 [Mycena pura]
MDDYVDVPYITLSTPPPSPGTQILLGETTPTLLQSHSTVTPTRKRRSGDTREERKKKRKQTTVVEDDGMQEQTPSWDSAGADLDMGSEPGWSSPERPPAQTPMDVPQDLHGSGYSEYCENIQEDGGTFYQLGVDLFVVNGWDPQKKISKTSWHHLQRTTISDSLQFLTDYGEELFPSDATFTKDGNKDAILFSRQELQEDVYLNHFSSTSPNSRSLGGRVIVKYTGNDMGTGRWFKLILLQQTKRSAIALLSIILFLKLDGQH